MLLKATKIKICANSYETTAGTFKNNPKCNQLQVGQYNYLNKSYLKLEKQDSPDE